MTNTGLCAMSDAARNKKGCRFTFTKITEKYSECFTKKDAGHNPGKDVLDKKRLADENGKNNKIGN